MDFMLCRACRTSLACGRGSDLTETLNISGTEFFQQRNFPGLFSGVMLGHGKLVIHFAVVINMVRFLRMMATRKSSNCFHCRSISKSLPTRFSVEAPNIPRGR